MNTTNIFWCRRSTIWDTIDTDGVILDEEGTEWSDRDCCEDPLENSKYSLEKRRAKEYVDLMEIHLRYLRFY